MANTIGMVVVAVLAASAAGVPLIAAITVTCCRTNSAASTGSLSYWASAKRYSIFTLRPSAKPASSRPRANGDRMRDRSPAVRLLRKHAGDREPHPEGRHDLPGAAGDRRRLRQHDLRRAA